MVRCSPAVAELLLVVQIQPSDDPQDEGEATRSQVTQLLIDEFANRRFGDMTVVSIHLQEVRRVSSGSGRGSVEDPTGRRFPLPESRSVVFRAAQSRAHSDSFEGHPTHKVGSPEGFF